MLQATHLCSPVMFVMKKWWKGYKWYAMLLGAFLLGSEPVDHSVLQASNVDELL